MNCCLYGIGLLRSVIGLGVIAGVASSISVASPSDALQQRGRGGQGRSGGGQTVHANRQVVRSSTYRPRSVGRQTQSAGENPGVEQAREFGGRPQSVTESYRSAPERIGQGSRPTFDHSGGAAGNRDFSRTAAGRDYDNGLSLHIGMRANAGWQRNYFPGGTYYYPYYSNRFGAGDYVSPFGFYFGICDPFILSTGCAVYPPSQDYINDPVYNGSTFSGWTETDDNAFDEATLNAMEPGLLNATDEISEAILNGNVDALVSLVDPNMSIAIYTQGKYQYSMKANDYLDLTRDAITSVKTVSLELNYLHRDSQTVYTVSGKQEYQGKNGEDRAVYLSFVLQDIGGVWTLTQAGTSPDRIQTLG